MFTYATSARCRCGAALAHDDAADACWSCSAVLLGDAVPDLSPGTDDHYHRHAQVLLKEKPLTVAEAAADFADTTERETLSLLK